MEDPNSRPEPDLYQQEEQCEKALRQVCKACFMRLVVTALLLFVLLMEPRPLWFWGLMGLVMAINLAGLLPLAAEARRRRRELKQLRSMEP